MKTLQVSNSEFVVYTMERLDKKYEALTAILKDESALDVEIINAATKRREVRACLNLFIEHDVDDESATAADILEIVTGTSIDKLQKQTPGGLLAQDLVEKTAVLAQVSAKLTKSSLNSFGSWLTKKTK